ncbi:hypothetical protein ACFXTH_000930 [Malus domestica]
MVDFPKSFSPKRVLKLLKAENNPHAAFALLDSVTRHPIYNHSPDVFHHILRRLVDSKLVTHVDRVVELVRTQKCKCHEDVALTVIKAYMKNSMPDKALVVFQQMEEIFGCAPGVRSYNSLLNAFIESNQQDRAEKFFAYFETVGLEPNLQTYNVLIKISCKKKHFEKAKGLLNWMWENGLEPDVVTESGESDGGVSRCKRKWRECLLVLQIHDGGVYKKMVDVVTIPWQLLIRHSNSP